MAGWRRSSASFRPDHPLREAVMAPISVPASRPSRILLATDLTSRCDRALDRAVQLAREWDAQLHVLHAIESQPPAAPLGVDPQTYARAHPDPEPAVRRALMR